MFTLIQPQQQDFGILHGFGEIQVHGFKWDILFIWIYLYILCNMHAHTHTTHTHTHTHTHMRARYPILNNGLTFLENNAFNKKMFQMKVVFKGDK